MWMVRGSVFTDGLLWKINTFKLENHVKGVRQWVAYPLKHSGHHEKHSTRIWVPVAAPTCRGLLHELWSKMAAVYLSLLLWSSSLLISLFPIELKIIEKKTKARIGELIVLAPSPSNHPGCKNIIFCPQNVYKVFNNKNIKLYIYLGDDSMDFISLIYSGWQPIAIVICVIW